MDKSAIETLLGNSKEISDRVSVETAGRGVYVPCGGSIADIEKFGDFPLRHRAEYITSHPQSFVDYCIQNESDQSPACYVHADGDQALMVFDHGQQEAPQWGDHTALLKPVISAAYKALLERCGDDSRPRANSQQDIIDWMEDWAPQLSAHTAAGAEITHAKALAAVRRITIKAGATSETSVRDMGASRSAFEEIEAKGADDNLPAYFVLHTPLYEHCGAHELRVRLGVRPDDKGQPALVLRILGHAAEKLAASKWLADFLREGITGAPVFVGSIQIQ